MSLCLKRKLEATVKPQNRFLTYISTYIVLLVSWLTLCMERMSAEHTLVYSPHTNFLVVEALDTLFPINTSF